MLQNQCMTNEAMAPAGWYNDGAGALRWWDGTQWTDHFAAPATPGTTGTAAAAQVSGQLSGFIFGIIALVLTFVPIVSSVLGLIGWGLSWKALKALPAGAPGRGLPTAGLVLSIIAAVVGTVSFFGILIWTTSQN